MTAIATIKNWFTTGKRPTQQQFWDTFSSFRHKEDKVPAADVEGLDELLFSKANKIPFEHHINSNVAHEELFGNKVDKDGEKGLSDENYTLAEKNKLAGLNSNGGGGNVLNTIIDLESINLASQDVDGLVGYLNELSPIITVSSSEIVKFRVSNTGQVFELLLNGRSFGSGEPAIEAIDVVVIKDIPWDELFPVKLFYQGTNSSLVPVGTYALASAGTPSFYQQDSGYLFAICTTASAGNTAYVKEGQVSCVIDNRGFRFSQRIFKSSFSSVPTARLFLGLADHSSIIGNIDPSTKSGASFAIIADSSDANLQLFHKTGIGSPVKIDLGVNFEKTAGLDLIITFHRFTDTSIIYYEVTNMTNSETVSGSVDYGSGNLAIYNNINTGTDAVAVAIGIQRISLQMSGK
jgi:hypothetical protein